MPDGELAETWVQRFPESIVNAADYFPLQEGLSWKYAGREVRRLEEGDTHKDTEEAFTNIVSVIGKEEVRGVTVSVFQDSNFNNRGQWIHYFRQEEPGIMNYGSKPPLIEQPAVPILWVPLPIEIPASFVSFDKKGIDTGQDADGDGKNETYDMKFTGINVGLESVSVPAGTYPGAARIEYRLDRRIHRTATDRFSDEPTFFLTMWFAKGIGLVKRVNRYQGYPSREGMLISTQELAGVMYSGM